MSQKTSQFFKSFIVLLAVFGVAACSSGGDERRLQGDRLSVITFERGLEADPDLSDIRIALPEPYVNQNWPQQGGGATHVLHHLQVADNLQMAWRAEIGRGSRSYERLVSAPVVANGYVYAVDIRGQVTAFQTSNGNQVWRAQVALESDRSRVDYGATLAYSNGRIFVSTGAGLLAALNATNGQELWRQNLDVPMRGGLTVAGGRVFALTQDNQLLAHDAATGEYLWDHIALVEVAGVLGAASPAVSGDTVIAAFSSGELVAFQSVNGTVTWQDALSRTGSLTALSTLNDIDAHPIIDRGRVYAISHSGRMAAIDLRTGERIWESNIGGIYQPWIAGSYMYVVTNENAVAALNLRDGRVRWVTELQRFEDPEDRKGLIRWAGPVLAGDRLLLTSSDGYMLSLSPYTGDVLSGMELREGTVIPPVVAGETVYVLTEGGELIAYR